MKSPEELAKKLAKQWGNASLRESRILQGENLPIRLPIGKPSPMLVRDDITALRRHLELWRKVPIGKVLTTPTTYRSLGQSINLPTHWEIQSVQDWVKASNSSEVQKQHNTLHSILHATHLEFHRHFVRMRSSWIEKNQEDVIKAAELAQLLTPNIADGAALRTIALAGIDTKFIERHRHLIIQLLDLRYDGKTSELGLENFLGAWCDNDHWVLVSDLNNHILPFSQQRVRTSELCKLDQVDVSRIIIIENERCLLQLPSMPSTIAILGCGLNLSWMNEKWLKQCHVAYWGDLDTWGLTMLSKARDAVSALTPLMMTQELFDQHASQKSVIEPTRASVDPPNHLTVSEQDLYIHLFSQKRGRLEQEFIPTPIIHRHFKHWDSLINEVESKKV